VPRETELSSPFRCELPHPSVVSLLAEAFRPVSRGHVRDREHGTQGDNVGLPYRPRFNSIGPGWEDRPWIVWLSQPKPVSGSVEGRERTAV